MPAEGGLRITPKLLLGLAIILVGVGFTLDNLGLLDFDRYVHFWPTLLIVVGAVKLVQARAPMGRAIGLLLLGAGVWFLLYESRLVDLDPERLWPILLVLLGCVFVWQALTGRVPQKGPVIDDAEEVFSFVLMGGLSRGSRSPSFRGGEVAAVMGGAEIDLRGAEVETAPAVIDAFAWWGGVDVLVPRHWRVVSKGLPVMGAFLDSTRSTAPPGEPHLVVRGLAVMGGVEIKHEPDEE